MEALELQALSCAYSIIYQRMEVVEIALYPLAPMVLSTLKLGHMLLLLLFCLWRDLQTRKLHLTQLE
jgi:hypothetical protein